MKTAIVPASAVGAFADGDVLPVLFFSVLFAFALLGIGPKDKPVVDGIELISQVLFKIIARFFQYDVQFLPQRSLRNRWSSLVTDKAGRWHNTRDPGYRRGYAVAWQMALAVSRWANCSQPIHQLLNAPFNSTSVRSPD